MPALAIIAIGLILGGVTGTLLTTKKISILPSWATSGDLIPNRLTAGPPGDVAGGGDTPAPLRDLAKVINGGLAVSAAGVTHSSAAIFGGNPNPVTRPIGVNPSDPYAGYYAGTGGAGPAAGLAPPAPPVTTTPSQPTSLSGSGSFGNISQ